MSRFRSGETRKRMSLLESSLGAIGLQRAGSSPGFDEETRAFLQSASTC